MRTSILAGLVLTSLTLSTPAPAEEPLDLIAFGSCAEQSDPQPIWDAIVATHPDLFLFIGDNVYADTQDEKELQAAYAMLAAQPGFQKLRASTPLVVAWDDHDYGKNDAGAELASKDMSQKVFLDFFHEPKDSARRKRPGTYVAHTYGPKGKRVQIIVLDTRYFRSPLRKASPAKRATGHSGPYGPSDTGTMLGDAQWKWLEQTLREPAELRIIVSSVQFVANDHHWEKWGNFPRERQHMIDLLRKTKARGVIFVSGDRHQAELSRLPSAETRLGYDLLDLTSSSLNKPLHWSNEVNRYRWGRVYGPVNFGVIQIDWSQQDPSIALQIRGLEGDTVLEYDTSLRALH